MSSKRQMVVDTLTRILGDVSTAETVVQVLQDEGWLNVGYGDQEVEQILAKFKDTYGTTKVTNSDRFAANRLAKQYGGRAVCGIIELLGGAVGEQFVPVVNNVVELENKWVSVLSFVRKERQGTETIKV